MAPVETPHFAHPFAFATVPGQGKIAVVNEQHSEEEITACVHRIVSYRRGFRDDLPEFGISDPTFQQAPIESDALVAEVAEWETRAELDASASIDSADELVSNLLFSIGVEREDA